MSVGKYQTCQVSQIWQVYPPISKGERLIKTLKCSDVGFECSAVVTAETVEDVLAQTVAQVQEAHGVTVTAAMAEEIAEKIEEHCRSIFEFFLNRDGSVDRTAYLPLFVSCFQPECLPKEGSDVSPLSIGTSIHSCGIPLGLAGMGNVS